MFFSYIRVRQVLRQMLKQRVKSEVFNISRGLSGLANIDVLKKQCLMAIIG